MVKEFNVTLGRKEHNIAFDFGFGYGVYNLLPRFGVDLEDLNAVRSNSDVDVHKKLQVFAAILLASHHYLCEQEGTEPILKNASQALKVLEQIPMDSIYEKFADSQETTIDPVAAPAAKGKKKA